MKRAVARKDVLRVLGDGEAITLINSLLVINCARLITTKRNATDVTGTLVSATNSKMDSRGVMQTTKTVTQDA
ncbi:MAG: hypothetical protein QF704_04070 [Anaerolineales bacterium]|jgi:hypothetical protein|nr:hypothetical protein [Anaerolineales bacterium]